MPPAPYSIVEHNRQLAGTLRSLWMLARASSLGAVVPEINRLLDRLGQELRAHAAREIEGLQSIMHGPDVTSQLVAHKTEHEALLQRIEAAAGSRVPGPHDTQLLLGLIEDIQEHMREEEADFASIPGTEPL